MKDIEKLNVEIMNHDELVLIEGGQCDCSAQGAGAASKVKAYFRAFIDALGKTPASSPYYYPGPKH